MTVLSEIVSIRTRYRRAVNLALDSRDACALDDILVTPLVRSTFERILASLENSNGERSFMLHGPYGSGKSTFALYVNALFSMGARDDSLPYEVLRRKERSLAKRFANLCTAKRPWLCLPLTGRRCSIGQIVLEGVSRALDSLPEGLQCENLRQRLDESLRTQGWLDSQNVLRLLEELRKLAAREHGGLLIIIDEAGKCLEYALQDRSGGDVYLFQMIAEYAKRVTDKPMLFLTVQHQYFDSYLELSNTLLRHEWAKVQERFEPLEFTAPLSSGLQTLGDVFKYEIPLSCDLLEHIKTEAGKMLEAGAKLPAGMTSEMFIDVCQRAWPLHPSVVLVLPLVFQRLAQNDRSIFSYLSSQEPHGFQEHCQSTDCDNDCGFVRLYDIANYLLTNMTATLVQRPVARNLLEVLRNETDLEPAQAQVLRTAGILNALRYPCLKATESILTCLLPEGSNVEEALHTLRRKELLTYRQFDETFRLWEGGSIDIEVLLKETRSKLRCEGQAFLELVRAYLPTRSLVPRKHCFETGAYRFFEVDYATSIEKQAAHRQEDTSSNAGTVLVLLPMDNRDSLEAAAKKATAEERSLVIAIPQQLDMLRQPAVEYACLRQLAKDTTELYGDTLALREYNALLADCERRLRQSADLLLDPRPAPYGNACKWFWNGEEQKAERHVDVTRLLSDVCDTLYPYAPMIKNELIARSALSSAATSARNILLKKMISCADQERLGIQGFPPERSMYESVLRETNLHVETEDGKWHLCEPTPDSPVYKIWKAIEEQVFSTPGEIVPLPQVFERLVLPPYGVPEGLLPVLALAFILCRKSEVFLYREGSFLVRIDEATVELMQRRPQLFAISGVYLTSERKKLVEHYAAGLHVESTVPAVVSKLFAAFGQLPAITKNSTMLPKRGKVLRDCFFTARSPEKLLFEDLPLAFGIPSLLTDEGKAEDLVQAIRESMIELTGYADVVRCDCRDVLLSACGLPAGTVGWNNLVERAEFLSQRRYQAGFSSHLQWLAHASSDRAVEAFLGHLSQRSFERWGDSDVAAFKIAAKGFGEQFCRAWQDYGTVFLNKEEQSSKEHVHDALSQVLAQVRGSMSSRVVAEALRELLKEVESSAPQEKQQ